jgi:hypothetical protein
VISGTSDVVQLAERVTTPPRQRAPAQRLGRHRIGRRQQFRLGDEIREHPGVQLVGPDHQLIAGSRSADPFGAEQPAKPGDPDLQRVGRIVRLRVAPHQFQQSIRSDHDAWVGAQRR